MATFDPIFAADPNNPELIAQDAEITIFDPDDPTMAPVEITDATGSPLPNPITVNEKGWGPAIKTPTGPGELFRIGWAGAGFTGFFTSYESMRDATLDAKAAAEFAASNAAGAATAALAGAASAASAAADSAASALAAAKEAQEAAEDAAAASSGGGVAIDPDDADVLLISTKNDGTVIIDPSDSDALLITT